VNDTRYPNLNYLTVSAESQSNHWFPFGGSRITPSSSKPSNYISRTQNNGGGTGEQQPSSSFASEMSAVAATSVSSTSINNNNYYQTEAAQPSAACNNHIVSPLNHANSLQPFIHTSYPNGTSLVQTNPYHVPLHRTVCTCRRTAIIAASTIPSHVPA